MLLFCDSNQLHHHIDDLKKELQNKDEEMAEKAKTLHQEMNDLQKSLTNMEMENEKSIRDKNHLIEKVHEKSSIIFYNVPCNNAQRISIW